MKRLSYFLIIPILLGVYAFAQNCGELCEFSTKKVVMAEKQKNEIPPCQSLPMTEKELSKLDQMNCDNKTCHFQGFVKSEFTMVECRMDQPKPLDLPETPMMIFTFQVVALPSLEASNTL